MTESLLAHSRQSLGSSQPAVAPPATRPRAEEASRSGSEAHGELAYYVYGVVSPRMDAPAGLAGVDPRYEVSLVEEEGLAALVSRVSLGEFGEEPLHENLNDVGWLEEKARAHEHVLDVVLGRGTVVPLRLCTIYNGEEQVREMLAREGAVMTDALDRL